MLITWYTLLSLKLASSAPIFFHSSPISSAWMSAHICGTYAVEKKEELDVENVNVQERHSK